MRDWRSNPAYVSAAIATAISAAGSGAFLIATLLGDYSWVARFGGAGWVFLLSMIILMPTVTPWVKRRMGAAPSRPSAR